MQLDKAIEILDLNIKQRAPSMPLDVLAALQLGREALYRILRQREANTGVAYPILVGETED